MHEWDDPNRLPPTGSIEQARTDYQLQEKMFSFSGEDFRVRDLSGQEVITIDGGNINLGGWVLDKLAFKEASSGAKFCSVERRCLPHHPRD